MSAAVLQFAVAGAAPAFGEPLHVGRPNVGDAAQFLRLAAEVLERRWLTNGGRCVREFEARMAGILGVRHCIPVCNATVALEIAVRALGLEGEVIVPSFTFVATAHALQWQEITPVFCDVHPCTHNLDPAKVEALITPRTTGIVGVHLWGRACDVEALSAIAEKRGLALMFDAAHAFACSHGSKMVGNFGRCEVFSFHATKFLNTFEGGAIATNDDALAEKIRLMKNFGFAGMDRVIHIGTNGKMSEVSAAMGLASLDQMDAFIARNRANHAAYSEGLAGVPGVEVAPYNAKERCNFQYVIAEVDEALFGLSRDALLGVLRAENVLARRYFYPGCHRMEPYRSLQPNAGLWLGETERLCGRVLALPTGTAVDEGSIGRICGIIRAAGEHAGALRPLLAETHP